MMTKRFIFLLLGLLTAGLFINSLSFAIPPRNMQQPAPDITGKTWLNSKPLSLSRLKGKVVMVEFWTYGCYNCVNVEPYIKSWYDRYKEKGFVVVGVHSPEFDHERKLDNVKNYIKRKQISYPVVIDNDFAIWRRYKNRYWPAMYLIDRQGQIRYLQIGEGRYQQTESMIQTLLQE
ncbi:MAG: redoxin domain-containing protein [Gammaproteobacteria bacterium]|nr:redoxin domain-containing protein [Gammaproteobacteria bacterium]